jgi:hypothetical protein
MKKFSSVHAIAVALAFTVNLHADEFSEHFIAARAVSSITLKEVRRSSSATKAR